ncbi:MAG: potassium channel protein [Candidatus Desulfofervidus auxilii]|nr:potassium channel protein [Candidatus Desulfofervidus auxilii]
MSDLRQIIKCIILFNFIILLGICGYIFIERWSFLDALYMTIITLTTVGFGEVHPLTPAGRVFTLIFILCGVGVAAYVFTTIGRILLEGYLKRVFGRKTMERRIKSLKHHYIVCGYGRIGRHVCKELSQYKIPIVVVEKNTNLLEDIEEHGFLYVHGEATREEVLIKAGIKNAAGLIAVAGSDADNVYIVLTAKELNPKLNIISRAGEEDAVKKLLRAGANKVIAPYEIGARKIARMVTHPLVTDFIELTVYRGIELQMGEIPIGEKAEIKNVSLKDSGLRQRFDVIVVAVRKATGEMIFNPSPETIIDSGDILIILGKSENLKKLEEVMDSASFYTHRHIL